MSFGPSSESWLLHVETLKSRGQNVIFDEHICYKTEGGSISPLTMMYTIAILMLGGGQCLLL